MKLKLFEYNYFPYEKKFLEKEVVKLGGKIMDSDDRYIEVEGLSVKHAHALTYIEKVETNTKSTNTLQADKEPINGKSSSRYQSTRYGPHGLHDYKGKFNPQTPRSLLLQNFDVPRNTILDPFMGSGTTIIEARALGFKAFGVELNPFAFEITKAKLFFEEIKSLPNMEVTTSKPSKINHPEKEYLLKWFTTKQYEDLINCLETINKYDKKTQTILKIVLSDQLRKNSLQDPRDLRIRRLKNIPNESNLLNDFIKRYTHLKDVHERWITLNGVQKNRPTILNNNSENLHKIIKVPVDGTVSSPPYFSALPYVDTYRLSMVALGIISPLSIGRTERGLTGARDITKTEIESAVNSSLKLPESVQSLTTHILAMLKNDQEAGFRKKAVPFNLLRYCYSMQKVLEALYRVERKGAQNFWVVGTNKTNISGESLVIDTPQIIADLAQASGFKNIELEPVDAYSRYDIHSKNSIRHEFIVKFSR